MFVLFFVFLPHLLANVANFMVNVVTSIFDVMGVLGANLHELGPIW